MKSGNGTYSFIDVKASITGPGGSFSLCGDSEGVAEEGIRIEPVDSKNTMTIGADGTGMHNLHGGNPATVTLVLLKNSPVNQQLMDMYNAQRVSSATWGKNVITIVNRATDDTSSIQFAAFHNPPSIQNQKDGGTNSWVFDAINVEHKLGKYN